MVSDKDDELKTRIENLLEAKTYIKKALHSHSDDLDQIRNYNLPDHEIILNLANNITLTYAAPRNWVEGMPLFKSKPPAPLDHEMQAGALKAYLKSTEAGIPDSKPDSNSSSNNIYSTLETTMQNLKSLLNKRKQAMEVEESNMGMKRSSDFKVSTNEMFNQTITEEINDPTKKSRKVNISFGFDDSDDSD